MLHFSLSYWFRLHSKALIGLFTCLCIALPSSNSFAIQKIYAGATQSTPDPIIPCITSGYAEDAVLNTTVKAGHTVIFHRVEPAVRGNNLGYVISQHTVDNQEREVIVYNARSMQILARKTFQIAGGALIYSNSLTGEIVNNRLMLFRTYTGGACPVFPCIVVSPMDHTGTILGDNITAIRADNLNDVRLSSASSLLLGYNNGAATVLGLFSIPIGTVIGSGGATGFTAPATLAVNGDMGNQYLGQTTIVTRTVKRVPNNAILTDATGTFQFSFSNVLARIITVPSAGLVIGDSTTVAGIAPQRSYHNASLTYTGTQAPFLNTDGNPQGSYWDETNQKIHSLRTGGPSVIRTDLFSTTVEQRYSCANCAGATGQTNGFIESLGRLYTSDGTAGRVVVRIKVCATGGPPV